MSEFEEEQTDKTDAILDRFRQSIKDICDALWDAFENAKKILEEKQNNKEEEK